MHVQQVRPDGARLAEVLAMAAAGRLTARIERTVSFGQAGEAIEATGRSDVATSGSCSTSSLRRIEGTAPCYVGRYGRPRSVAEADGSSDQVEADLAALVREDA